MSMQSNNNKRNTLRRVTMYVGYAAMITTVALHFFAFKFALDQGGHFEYVLPLFLLSAPAFVAGKWFTIRPLPHSP